MVTPIPQPQTQKAEIFNNLFNRVYCHTFREYYLCLLLCETYLKLMLQKFLIVKKARNFIRLQFKIFIIFKV